MIGVYVHNRGRGHLHRVLPVVAALRDRGDEVTMLVTGPFDDTQRPPGTRVVHLPTEPDARTGPAAAHAAGP
ncbi:glycosyltransferase family 1 protein, partial [Dietzia maris]|nr:glycosyltransferase family 1 protein [Dietzia maris]